MTAAAPADDPRIEGPCGPLPPEAAHLDEAVARFLGAGAELGDGQRDAILAALTTDTLAVLPPAAGKTAIYAITGDLLGGRTIVVSPTLSLHRDQVAHLTDAGVAAGALNSEDGRGALAAFVAGEMSVLVTSPEQLARPDVLRELAGAAPTLLAVDEAHCVSDWGPDFRPDYLALAPAARALGSPRILALTATASVPAREEILDLLGIPDACVVVRDVDRPQTHLAVHLVHDEEAKWRQVVDAVLAASGPGIVYVTTRGHTTLLADRLKDAGVTAGAYHGGLRKRERQAVQDAFMADDLSVVVATSAFGMGIDKPGVRWIVHGDVPTSIDAYHQEIGRAARDGGSAHAVMFHRPQDLARPKLFASGRDARAAALATVVEAIRLHDDGVAQAELADAAGLSKAALSRAIPALVVGGSVVQAPGRRLLAGINEAPAIEVARAAAELVTRSRERQRSKVELVRRYAEGTGCRRRTLLEVLGEARDAACGNCDHCDAGDVGDPGGRSGASHGEPTPGEAVRHDEWGRGVVQTVADDSVVVLFDDAGYRTLSIPVLRERGLLTSV
ncbi:RecQ family ATP-dependent DNA helicase [Actinomycetospora sp. NBRC 106378]|uniref:RecQ family ATP-dependent DNA helicase n=1 Tax=Actinomycetospora sp. NBRC 106378 TaxID=3032208 RepID=UPI0024A45DB9|nr:RecQ family ATP-dependent DNA helicase [Actinomycetospora sp. NBRC 106378]GLZ55998.1 ATP-dependent DNA helicase RecQ [Actinomycetospora sp. NBRC 106378]